MKLIVALGNPGAEYTTTRHNAAWVVIDSWLESIDKIQFKSKFKSECCEINLSGEKILILKPQTFMNLSGEAVISAMNFYKIHIKDILIMHDEKDFVFGRTALKFGGSTGGHNGLKNIVSHLGTENFARLRIGIDNPRDGYKIIDWVLSKMSLDEIAKLKNIGHNLSNLIKDFSKNVEFNKLMSKYNSK